MERPGGRWCKDSRFGSRSMGNELRDALEEPRVAGRAWSAASGSGAGAGLGLDDGCPNALGPPVGSSDGAGGGFDAAWGRTMPTLEAVVLRERAAGGEFGGPGSRATQRTATSSRPGRSQMQPFAKLGPSGPARCSRSLLRGVLGSGGAAGRSFARSGCCATRPVAASWRPGLSQCSRSLVHGVLGSRGAAGGGLEASSVRATRLVAKLGACWAWSAKPVDSLGRGGFAQRSTRPAPGAALPVADSGWVRRLSRSGPVSRENGRRFGAW
jgi:hypothetical protein